MTWQWDVRYERRISKREKLMLKKRIFLSVHIQKVFTIAKFYVIPHKVKCCFRSCDMGLSVFFICLLVFVAVLIPLLCL